MSFLFADDAELFGSEPELSTVPELSPWKILLVDDEPDIHGVTKMALSGFQMDGRKLIFFHAYSGQQAKQILESEADIALVFLDVVMECDDSGLEVARWIRQDLENKFIRIILRTGQAGQAPEERVIVDYDINDYKEKTELTYKKLFTTTLTGLRAYRDIMQLEAARLWQLNHSNTLDAEVKLRTADLNAAVSRLKQLDKEKNDFLGIAAHDLKNPLTGIIGMSELMQKHSDVISADQNKQYLACINKSGQHMMHIITNLLNVNAFETGHLNVKLQALDLQKIVQDVTDQYENTFKAKNLELVWELEETVVVNADYDALVQIIDNLVSNAIKYSPLGKHIWLSISADEKVGRFQVRDEGSGLSEQDQLHLFEQFTRLSTLPTAGEHSSGLGLSIVKKLCLAMSGNVYCKSIFGQGCSFVIELPLAGVASAASAPSHVA